MSTKDKIRTATLSLIAAEGFQHVTTRKIAQLAEVNVAAINYHFGGKEHVIEDVLKHLLETMKQSFSYLQLPNTPPQERLKSFVRHYAAVLFQYPDLIRRFIYHSIRNESAPNAYREYLASEGCVLLSATIEEVGGYTRSEAILQAMQLIGALAFPALIGDNVQTIFQFDGTDPQQQERYQEVLLRNIVRAK